MNNANSMVSHIQEFEQIKKYYSPEWKILVHSTNNSNNKTYIILHNDTKKSILIATPEFHATIRWFAIRHHWKDKGFEFIHYFITTIAVIQQLSDGPKEQNTQLHPASENIELLKDILSIAVAYQASNIHFDIQEKKSIVYFRRYMQLHVWRQFPRQQILNMLISAYMLDIDVTSGIARNFNHRLAQSAIIPIKIDDKSLNLRYQSYPIVGGLNVVLSIVQMKDPGSFELIDLGYTPQQISMIKNSLSQGKGGIFISGAAGSGKTTTLSVLMHLLGQMHPDQKRYALESSTEYRLDGVMLMPICRDNHDISITEQSFLSFLSMNPNIGMIEINDKDTAFLTQTAIEKGHQILATIQATSAWGIIDQLSSQKYGLLREKVLAPGFIRLLVYQKLLPIVCPHCRRPAEKVIEPITLKELCKKYGLVAKNIYCISEVGCQYCVPENQDRQFLSYLGVAGMTVVADVIDPTQTNSNKKNDLSLLSSDDKIQQHALHKVSMGLVDPRFLSFDGFSF